MRWIFQNPISKGEYGKIIQIFMFSRPSPILRHIFKGLDLNCRFSKIDFLSGYSRWVCQIKKLSLMGCLKCQDETSKNFDFQPGKWPILKILVSNPKISLVYHFSLVLPFMINFWVRFERF